MSILVFDEVAPVLEAVGMAEAKNEPFDVEQVSRVLGIPRDALRATCEEAESARLILAPPDEPGEPALLTHAGGQYLALRGQVSEDTLFFLAEVIGDLHGREALMRAGTLLVDEFRHAILQGRAVDHAEELVPVAFKAAVDDRLAVDLFAASVALMTRLSSGDAAGCLAEEIIAVALLDEARALLDTRLEEGEIGAADAKAAKPRRRCGRSSISSGTPTSSSCSRWRSRLMRRSPDTPRSTDSWAAQTSASRLGLSPLALPHRRGICLYRLRLSVSAALARWVTAGVPGLMTVWRLNDGASGGAAGQRS